MKSRDYKLENNLPIFQQLVSSGQLTQNFLLASTQKLREPIPQNNSKTWTSPFPKQAKQGHVRSRAHTSARKCIQSYLIFPRTPSKSGTAQHMQARARFSTNPKLQ